MVNFANNAMSSPTVSSQRLDRALVDRNCVDSRSRAQRAIRNGWVLVNGNIVNKPSYLVSDDDEIALSNREQYVSRAGGKLMSALQAFQPLGFPTVENANCLDIGASTGGFTQVLLEHGAHSVIALDVGHDQLHSHIRHNPRVIEMSGCNIRDVTAEDLPFRPTIIVSDVSFISLRYVIPIIANIASPEGAECIVLIKPQFEVGREHLGADGVILDPQLHRRAIDLVIQCAQEHHCVIHHCVPSAVVGSHGNQEFLLWFSVRGK